MRKKHISAEPIYRLRCIVYYIPQDCLDMSHAVNYLARDRHCFTCLLWLHSHIFCNVFWMDEWKDGWGSLNELLQNQCITRLHEIRY